MAVSRQNLAAYLVTAAGATLWSQPVVAQSDGVSLRGEVFGGIARDERPRIGPKKEFSGGALPSVVFNPNGAVVVQLDGMVADHLGDTIWAGGGHIGVRANDSTTIGVYAAYSHFDRAINVDSYRIGGEARFSGGPVSVSGVVGYEHSDRGRLVVGPSPSLIASARYTKRGSVFSMADVIFHPHDSWAVTAGHRYVGRRHTAAVGAEAGLGSSGVSLFAEGRVGNERYTAGWAGVRVKLGARSGPLRERENAGFTNRLKDELFWPNRVVVPPPAPPEPPVGGGGSVCCGPCLS